MDPKWKKIPYPATQEDRDFEEMYHMLNDLYHAAKDVIARKPDGWQHLEEAVARIEGAE